MKRVEQQTVGLVKEKMNMKSRADFSVRRSRATTRT
jgi:hypothetical protein